MTDDFFDDWFNATHKRTLINRETFGEGKLEQAMLDSQYKQLKRHCREAWDAALAAKKIFVD